MSYKSEKPLILLYDRISSGNKKGISSSSETQRTRSGTGTDYYTELGIENVTSEPENQYESLARQENYGVTTWYSAKQRHTLSVKI